MKFSQEFPLIRITDYVKKKAAINGLTKDANRYVQDNDDPAVPFLTKFDFYRDLNTAYRN